MKHVKYSLLVIVMMATLSLTPISAYAEGGDGGGGGGAALPAASGGAISGGTAVTAGQNNEDALKTEWVAAFMLMTNQLSAMMIQQVEIIGTFFDAKHQLESQRLFQQKVAEAHKDYQPSEQMCQIGTFARNLARTEEGIKITRNAIQNASLARALATGAVKTMDNIGSSDELTRRTAYIDKFCNIADNGGQNNLLCTTSKAANQQNADLNYSQTIDFPLTLNLNFNDGETSPEEENIFAFLDQIFLNDPFPDVPRDQTVLHNFVKPYQEMRSLIAMRSVAQNSFAQIIGEKTMADEGAGNITPYIRSLLKEMGLDNKSIADYLGANPSYHAQMEVLTKKIFQNPNFVANLYDKPANVKRIRAALSAIKLMQDRDIQNAMQRREMLTSMILELQLRYKQNALNNNIEAVIAVLPIVPMDSYSGEAQQNINNGAGGI